MPLPCLWQVGIGEVRLVTSGKACQIAALALGGGAGWGQFTRTQGCEQGSVMSACIIDGVLLLCLSLPRCRLPFQSVPPQNDIFMDCAQVSIWSISAGRGKQVTITAFYSTFSVPPDSPHPFLPSTQKTFFFLLQNQHSTVVLKISEIQSQKKCFLLMCS